MKDYEFYQKYANTPFAERDILFLFRNEYINLNKIYKEIKNIDDRTRVDLIRKENLLEAYQERIKGVSND